VDEVDEARVRGDRDSVVSGFPGTVLRGARYAGFREQPGSLGQNSRFATPTGRVIISTGTVVDPRGAAPGSSEVAKIDPWFGE